MAQLRQFTCTDNCCAIGLCQLPAQRSHKMGSTELVCLLSWGALEAGAGELCSVYFSGMGPVQAQRWAAEQSCLGCLSSSLSKLYSTKENALSSPTVCRSSLLFECCAASGDGMIARQTEATSDHWEVCYQGPVNLLKPKIASHKASDQLVSWIPYQYFWRECICSSSQAYHMLCAAVSCVGVHVCIFISYLRQGEGLF